MAVNQDPTSQETGNSQTQLILPTEELTLTVTIDVAAGAFRFEWLRADSSVAATGQLIPHSGTFVWYNVLNWEFECGGKLEHGGCTAWPSSTRALINRIRKRLPVKPQGVKLGLLADQDLGMAKAGRWLPMVLPSGTDPWHWLSRQTLEFARLVQRPTPGAQSAMDASTALYFLACGLLGVAPELRNRAARNSEGRLLSDLSVTFNQVQGAAEFEWIQTASGDRLAAGVVRCTGANQLSWQLDTDGQSQTEVTTHARESIRGILDLWLKRFPTNRSTFRGSWIEVDGRSGQTVRKPEPPFGPDESPYQWVEDNLVGMAEALRFTFTPLGRMMQQAEAGELVDFERYSRRLARKEEKRAQEEERRQAVMAQLAVERRRREEERKQARKATQAAVAAQSSAPAAAPKPRPPLPPVSVHLELPPLEFQETAFPLDNLAGYSLRERAALWWVSNQSDDLLCLPYCRIEHLEYQRRAALRVLGPLRGRALLSDEVGLGKTIEAGLVIKELLTRGMVKRFLVLTVPSLVDQWEEELAEKFGLSTVTTNQTAAREDPAGFWNAPSGIVASLHTLKQPAQLEVARKIHWDILVVDEAHYLRNRESQAWQAVSSLSRQFLLLLTATPVQNSLEELYNLVTLLQPGQLPSPREFRARFVDPKRPRQPREPEELRRLLNQVMVRNTRSNAGIQLPPRRAETVLFEPDEAESAFWRKWDADFRACLAQLNAAQASLWGRLLLQAAGSSPAAWQTSLTKFPDRARAQAWRSEAPLPASWHRKCLLIPPLTRGEGGAVIFTQFLETQAALADFLQRESISTFVINGATPPVDRQPITDEFRKRGGALLLTHSGTEGRNLQFCHRLVNFDLPWNPMEIEQRIGRLHRLGQSHPVRIYNFVQVGTLQEHLLQVLQEKLNLFELVVGETGLVLGDKFGSDDFAEEVFRLWRESEGRVAEAIASLGDQLAAGREQYGEVKKLDETLFATDYESI